MKAERIARWAVAVSPQIAANMAGISITTLGRWTSGQTEPTGAALRLLTAAVEAWEKTQTEAK